MSAPDPDLPAHLAQAVEPFPERFNLCHYFLDHNIEAGRGDQIALLSGDETRTYAEISRGARCVASLLRGIGVQRGELVLILLPDRFEFAEVFFGILRSGAAFSMVNPLLKAKDLAYYMEYTGARAVFAHDSTLSELETALESVAVKPEVFAVGDRSGAFTPYASALEAQDPDSEAARLEGTGADDLAGWLFTSGSTGRPKGCVHVHGDFAWNAETYARQVVQYSATDRCVSVPKLFFGYATGTNLMFPFRAGGSAILFEGRATPDEVLAQIARHRPTLLTSVPTMIGGMLRSENFEQADLSCLRVCLSAGEALPPHLYSEWKERTGVEILDGIGSAEMFHIYISNQLDDVQLGSLGRIVPGYEAQIIGPDDVEVPTGEPGRLRVRGGSIASEYFGDAEKTAETYVGGWCVSADIFRRDEAGYFYYEGRTDDLIKVSGIWTSPLEIENVLAEHPDVEEACVVGHEDTESLIKPFAFIVLREGCVGGDELATELKGWVKGRLAPHKYPRWFEWRDELPRNDRGKVARRMLAQELMQRTKA